MRARSVATASLRTGRSASATARHMPIGSADSMAERLQPIGHASRVDHADDEDEIGTVLYGFPIRHRGSWPLEVEIAFPLRSTIIVRSQNRAGDVHHEHYRCEPRDLHRGK